MRRALRFLCLAMTLATAVSVAFAVHTDVYVDSGCTNNGNGGCNGGTGAPDCNCATGAGAAGPYNDVTTATVGGVSCDTTVWIRGVHATHGSNHAAGTTSGRYFHDYVDIHGKACTSGTPIIIQPASYTTPGSGEAVYLDGTAAPTWTQCTWDGSACDCDAGHQNVQIGAGGSTACTETWYITGSGTYDKALGFQKPDGSPTYRVAQRQCAITTTTKCKKDSECPGGADICTGFDHTLSLALMTNASAGYNAKACADVGAVDYTWMRCNTDADCPSGSTCAAAQSPEIDSFTTEGSGGVAFVRWAASPASATHRVYNNADGIGFYVYNSSFITIRGLNFRAHVREGVSFLDSGGPTLDSTVTDNRFYYNCYQKNSGPDYGIAVRQSNRITVSGNNIGYTTSEGIHARTVATGATVYAISNNWIHDIGDQNVLGTQCSGTPSGVILTDDYSGGDGNYTGSTFSGNLIQRPATHDDYGGSVGRGMIIEDDSSGWTVYSNVIDTPAGECVKLDGSVLASSNIFYNNLLINCGNNFGPAGGAGTCIFIYANSGSGNASSNEFWNNTLYNCAGHGIVDDCGGSTCSSNKFANNIIQPASGKQCVNWTKSGSNVFQYNLCNTGATNPSATFEGTSKACASLTDLGAGNVTTCTDSSFVNTATKDFHIVTGSLAKNAGTASGLPAGRTADINNTLASSHGLPSYADSTTIKSSWDIGADEFDSGTTTKVMVVSRLWQVSACGPAR